MLSGLMHLFVKEVGWAPSRFRTTSVEEEKMDKNIG